MLKSNMLKRGDRIAVVSLSSGILGEPSCEHQVQLAIRRFESLGLTPVFMPHALKGLDFVLNHPEKRAEDLKAAFADETIRAVFCAIGGNDTLKIAPYLLNDPDFIKNVQNDPKIFTGFSDTTNNHFLFYKLGMVSYYGPNVMNDIAELDCTMLPYSEKSVMKLFSNEPQFDITSSPLWYEERHDFSSEALNTPRIAREEEHGYEVLRGSGIVRGHLLGGCLESIAEMITDASGLVGEYGLFPTLKQWSGAILFLETSEEKPSPQQVQEMLGLLKGSGILDVVAAVIVGKPQDEVHYEAYKNIYLVTCDCPILYNVNFGHSYPRAILPYGLVTEINFDVKSIRVIEPFFSEV